jgi:hypothetical protein
LCTQPALITTLVDALFERVRVGLLVRDARKHQRQLLQVRACVRCVLFPCISPQQVRLLGELYNYSLYDSNVVFDLLVSSATRVCVCA